MRRNGRVVVTVVTVTHTYLVVTGCQACVKPFLLTVSSQGLQSTVGKGRTGGPARFRERLGKSVPQFSHLQEEDNNNTNLKRLS